MTKTQIEVLVEQASMGLLDPETVLFPEEELVISVEVLDQIVSLADQTFRPGQPISDKDFKQGFPALIPYLR